MGSVSGPLYFDSAADIATNSFVAANCTVGAKNVLSCTDQTADTLEYCDGDVTGIYISEELDSGCLSTTLNVVAV